MGVDYRLVYYFEYMQSAHAMEREARDYSDATKGKLGRFAGIQRARGKASLSESRGRRAVSPT